MEIPVSSGDGSLEVDLNDTDIGAFDALMQGHNSYADVASLTGSLFPDQLAARIALVALGVSPYDACQYDAGQIQRHFEGNPEQWRMAQNTPGLPPEARQWLGEICTDSNATLGVRSAEAL